MPTFNIDELIAKATDILDKASTRALEESDRYDQLIELINDTQLRESVNSVVGGAIVLGTTVAARLGAIFAKPEPEPTPDYNAHEEEPLSQEDRDAIIAQLRAVFGDDIGPISFS